MLFQSKAIKEKAAEHEGNLLFGSAIRQARSDIVFIAIEPGRTENLTNLAVPRLSDKAFQRDVSAREPCWGISYLVVVIRADFMLAGPDRDNFEGELPCVLMCGLRLYGLRLCPCGTIQQREKRDWKQRPHAVYEPVHDEP